MADTAFTEITTGLQFPEGPVAMPDGSVILTEMFASRITRVSPDGTKTTVAEINGSPNGLAVGPDGALYLCNNGNAFTPLNMGGLLYPGFFDESKYIGGRIQRVDISTGKVTDLYTHCGDIQLRAPNDIVFDKHGGFYFTDHGTRSERTADRTGIYYAKPDGSFIEEVAFPIDGPNGIGLSPDENTLYWAETHTGRVYQCAVTSPGKLAPRNAPEVEGEWWTPLIITAVSGGALRFEAIQNSLGIARNILTDRLNTLVTGGILEKHRYTEKPQRYEYHLTTKGEEMIPVPEGLERRGKGHDSRPVASTVLCGLPGYQLFDSLAVDGDGNVCVATIVNGGITVISPKGEVLQHIAVDDRITTNICFGGPDYQTAYITASSTGRLLAMKWPYKGLKLNY